MSKNNYATFDESRKAPRTRRHQIVAPRLRVQQELGGQLGTSRMCAAIIGIKLARAITGPARHRIC